MLRRSSRGNPWHDERGRFCSGPKAAVMSIAADVVDVYGMSDEEKNEIESFSLNKEEDVANYYNNQTIGRYVNADALSRYTPSPESRFSKDDTPEERERKTELQKKEEEIARKACIKENAIALSKGATLNAYRNDDTGEVQYTVYDAEEIVNQTLKGYQTKAGKLHKDSSTNMRTADGFVVFMGYADEAEKIRDKESGKRDRRKDIRTTKMNATQKEMVDLVHHYEETHKKELAQQGNHLCTWYDPKTEQFYCGISTWHKTKSEAEMVANARLNASIANCKTGERVAKHPGIEAAERKYDDVRKRTAKNARDTLVPGEFLVGNEKDGGIKVNDNKDMVDTKTGEILRPREVQRRARVERDAKRTFLNKANRTTVKER